MSSQRSVKTLAIEAVVIVGSILFAFAVDAWWDSRVDAERREAVRSSLRSDMVLARTDLDRVLGLTTSALDAVDEILRETVDGPIPVEKRARIDSLVLAGTGGGSFDPPVGTIEALMGSGQLELLKNEVLVAELTSLPGRLSDLNREMAFSRDALLAFMADLRADGLGIDFGWGSNTDLGDVRPGWVGQRPQLAQILHTPPYRSHLSLLWAVTRNGLNDLREIDSSMRIIEAELR